MQEKANGSHTLGFDLTEDYIKAASLSGDAKRPKLEGVFEISLEREGGDSSNVKPLYTDEQKKILQHLIGKNLIVTAIPTNQTLIRPLEIKLTKDHDIDAALYFQSEPLLPYPVETAIVDRITVVKTKEGSTLTVAAAQKETVTDHIKQWEAFNIEPEIVSCVPLALALFCGKNEKLLYCIHIENNEIICALIDNGKLLAAKSSAIGLDQAYAAYIQDEPRGNKETFNQLNIVTINANQYPSLLETLEQLSLEAIRLCYSHSKRLKGADVDNLIVTGDAAAMNSFDVYLTKKLDKTLTDPQERSLFKQPLNEQKKYAVPIGLALSALNNETQQINFRQQELVFPDPWKRIKTPILTYFALSGLLTLSIYLMTLVYVDSKEDSLRSDYADLLLVSKKDYEKFEKEIAAKNQIGANKNSVIPSLSEMPLYELRKRLNDIETEIKNTPAMFPLLPNIPKVSDVLAWLSSNEISLGTKDKNGEINPQIELDKFSYKLVKRPEKNKLNDKYQVKVDLEITATSPSVAREFHDFLMLPNDIVDPTNEIKWSTTRGKYLTSFYLKDKTVYQIGGK